MNILAIESSCDETAVSIVQNGRKVLTDQIASQVDLHRIYGGVVPEIASRKHVEAVIGVIDTAVKKANVTLDEIDYIGVEDHGGCKLCDAFVFEKERARVSIADTRAALQYAEATVGS